MPCCRRPQLKQPSYVQRNRRTLPRHLRSLQGLKGPAPHLLSSIFTSMQPDEIDQATNARRNYVESRGARRPRLRSLAGEHLSVNQDFTS